VIGTRLVGTGRALPARVVTNDELSRRVDTDDEWIRTRTGIRERRILGEGEATSDLVAGAGHRALEAAGLAPGDVDALVVSTATPDKPMPSCAAIAQHKLGLRGPALDVNAACAGFSYGLTVVDALIRAGVYRRVLFVGAEGLSKFLDWDDRGTCILFGDGAGAVVCVAEERGEGAAARGVLSTYLDADGGFAGELDIRGGGTLHPPSADTVADNLHVMRMNGRVIFSQAVRHLAEACEHAMTAAGLTCDDVDLVVPHQANLRIIEAVARRLAIPEDRFLINLDRYGNTSAASIPIALDEGVRGGRIRPGTTLVACGLGAGLTWGAAAIRW
jgi:3-oxoacyl-[acyl-carrier-protein] synthase III